MEFTWDSRSALVQQHQEHQDRTNDNARKGPPRVSIDNCDEIFCFLGDYGVLVCRQHRTAVINLEKHLRQQHAVSLQQRRQIVQHFNELALVSPDAVELPEEPATPFDELGQPLDGLQCRTCRWRTTNANRMRMHCKKNHQQSWTGDKSVLYEFVKVQTFFSSGGLQKYFLVNLDVAENGQRLDHNQVAQQQLSDYQKVRKQLENDSHVMEDAAKTDKFGWFKRTGWLAFPKGQNLAHLGYTARLPDRNEVKLQTAARLTEQQIEKCVKGLATLPRETRRWLRSAKHNEVDQRPLARLQNPESQATYASYIVRFVCFYLRILADEESRVDEYLSQRSQVVDSSDEGSGEDAGIESECEYNDNDNDNDSNADSTDNDSIAPTRRPRKSVVKDTMKDARELFSWKGDQKELAMQLWLMLDGSDRAAQMGALLQSLSSFVMTSYGNDELSSGLVQYLAVLGIDTETKRLRTAKNYSYMLAGMVYCIRVLAVESILPAAGRDDQTEEDRDRFLEMRKKYLADGSYSPMSVTISLLAYGKRAAMNEGNAGNAYWSVDKKIFYLNGRPIGIERFRRMARDIVAEAVEQFWQLCWVEAVTDRFTINLAQIVDDISFTTRGRSFVNDPANGLCDGLAWMLARARKRDGGMKLQTVDGRWRAKKVRQYLQQMDRFLELLLFSVHVTSGQPGRGSEITTIRHCNGLLQDRNIFVVDGAIMTVVRYHKSQSQLDRPKIVPRFLPPSLGQIMALYLGYLRPFREYLTVQVLGGGLSDYIWCNEQGAWGTDRLTRVIRRETGTRLGVDLHTQGYRHAAVGIGRVKVGESFGRGYQDEVGEVDEAEVDEDEEDLIELQNSRTTAMGVSNYSVPIDIIKHLSVRSIDAFRALSTAWHCFLGVDGQAGQHEALIPRQKRKMRENRSGFDVWPKAKAVQVEDTRTTAVHRALQQVLGKQDVGFRSMEQEQALEAVLDKQTPLVVVLPTGGGKSLLFTLPACIEGAGVTVVIVPYRALIEDLVDRIHKYGVDCIEWKHGESNPASVVVVSADKAGDVSSNGNFLGYAQVLKGKGLLQRIVVDECHLVLTARHWRKKLLKVKNLQVLGCPMVLLTATLPPLREEELETSMLARNATYVRASTVRPNARYFVSWCQRETLESTALAMCRRWAARLRRTGQKGVVYCLSKPQSERLAEELGCSYYHADVEDDERAERLRAWAEHGGLIVATSALGTGVDFAEIVYILHVGMPWSITDFAQASGRGGRGGEAFDVVVVLEHGEVERRMEQEGDDMEVVAMGQFLVGSGCRRQLMSSYMDVQGVGCREIGAVNCDRCGEGEAAWLQEQERWAREWAMVEDKFTELRNGCAICWFVGQERALHDEDLWRRHRTMQCTAWEHGTGAGADAFRRKIVDRTARDNCRRCWVSQKYCATGEGMDKRCQWPNVVVPLAYAARLTTRGIRTMGESGFREMGDEAYAAWLGKGSQEEVWGRVFTNAMVMAIRLVLGASRGREEEIG
jgi:superfamily II DNA or RNA helicase